MSRLERFFCDLAAMTVMAALGFFLVWLLLG